MAKYYILSNGHKYRVSMSDATDYTMMDNLPTEDIIHYTVNLDEGEREGTISAWIENPSQHTLYLIEQGRCSIAINYKRVKPNSAIGYHCYYWDSEIRRNIAHSSGLGRGRYRFHRHWSLASNRAIKVVDYTNIEIPFTYSNSWGNVINFLNCNWYLKWWSEHYQNPELDEFYFDIRLSLLSNQTPQAWMPYDGAELQRTYQSKSKITRLTFQAL